MLLLYGIETVESTWYVNENVPTDFARVYFIDGGEVSYKDEEKELKLKKDFVYILPTSMAYSVEHNPSKPLECMYIHLDLFPNITNDIIEIDVSRDKFLYHLFAAMRISIQSENYKMIELLSEAFNEYCCAEKLILQPTTVIRKILEYISLNIREKISIDTLSRIAGYNPQYFLRLFKNRTGITPHQYIVSYRLKEAVKLLKTDISISQIARNVGYSDVNSFSRAFKLRYSIAPSRFMNQLP